jgi:RNA polymerase sigma-70 factor (ECF subfamily)
MDDDKQLIQRALAGEKEAFEMIIQRYQQPLLNYIGRTLGQYELALEFTQEVFIKTYSSLHTYQPRYKFSTWLFKIASNYIIDYWRKKKIDALSIDQQESSSYRIHPIQIASKEIPVCRSFELAELTQKVEEALQALPPALRELFIWRHINDLSYEEMAEIKDLPVGTVKNRVFQAKELIRKRLEDNL